MKQAKMVLALMLAIVLVSQCAVVAQAGDIGQIKAFVTRCYYVIMNRQPDQSGLDYWVEHLSSGRKTAAEIIDGFVNSKEFKAKQYSKSTCVEILYNAMLDRPSEPAGKDYWVGKLNAGNSLSYVVNGFCTSNEFGVLCSKYGIRPGSVKNVKAVEEPAGTNVDWNKVTVFVTRCYRVILGREPDDGGLQYWVGILGSGKQAASEIIYGFMTSNEYRNRGYSDSASIEILYRAMLGRDSDQSGKLYWLGIVNGGNSLAFVINGFCTSTEFKRLCAEYGIKPGSVPTGPAKPAVPVDLTTGTETADEPIPYGTEYQNDPNRYASEGNVVIRAGVNGVRRVTYTVTYSNGTEVSREKAGETVISDPVNEIISVPCKDHIVETREEIETIDIPFTTDYRYDTSRQRGEADIVLQEGVNGEIKYIYTATYTDGVLSSRILSDTVEIAPVTKIISIADGEPIPVITYEVVALPTLPGADAERRSPLMDNIAVDWAMHMAKDNEVRHDMQSGFGNAVGGWGTLEEVLYGRDVSGTGVLVSLASHAGQALKEAYHWGAGCVDRIETFPDGTVHHCLFACAFNDFGAEDIYNEMVNGQ